MTAPAGAPTAGSIEPPRLPGDRDVVRLVRGPDRADPRRGTGCRPRHRQLRHRPGQRARGTRPSSPPISSRPRCTSWATSSGCSPAAREPAGARPRAGRPADVAGAGPGGVAARPGRDGARLLAPDNGASRVAAGACSPTPVQFWSGWPFLVGAARRARHRSANMDTLIAVGTLAAFGYSVVALFTGGDLYFETAGPAHRVPVARPVPGGPGRGGAPPRRSAPCWSSAPRRRALVVDGRGATRSRRRGPRRRPPAGPPGREDPRRRRGRRRRGGRRRVDAHRRVGAGRQGARRSGRRRHRQPRRRADHRGDGGRAPTPRWPRSCGWSRRRRTARRRCSALADRIAAVFVPARPGDRRSSPSRLWAFSPATRETGCAPPLPC